MVRLGAPGAALPARARLVRQSIVLGCASPAAADRCAVPSPATGPASGVARRSSGARARLVVVVGEPPYRGVPHPPTVTHHPADLPQGKTKTYGVTFRTLAQHRGAKPSAININDLRLTFRTTAQHRGTPSAGPRLRRCDDRRAPVSSPPRGHSGALSRRPSTGLRASPRHRGSSAVARSTRPDRSSRSIAAAKASAPVRRPSGIRANSFGA